MNENKVKIALYGLSTETERAIKIFNEYEIVGLLDVFKQEGELFGKPIISLDNAISKGIEKIIVVARPGSCKAIARRIGEICNKAGIQVFDIRGKNLLTDEKDIWSYEKIVSYIENECAKSSNFSSAIKKRLFIEKLENVSEKNATEVIIASAYDIGYLFCAPMITDFVIWFSNYIDENKVDNIWFLARDGYLIKKLFDIANTKESIYFLTSRTAAIRAGVRDVDDLEYVESMKFSGTLTQNIKERFGLTIEEKENDNFYNYSFNILSRAKTISDGYTKYISQKNLKDGNIAIFDFVAKGTTQYFLQRLVPDNHIKGLYFLQLEPAFMADKKLDIVPFYTEAELEKSAIFDNYYILETILTSFEPSCVEFTEQGEPVFVNETRAEEAKDCVKSMQQGIIDYFTRYISEVKDIAKNEYIDKSFDECFLNIIHNVKIEDTQFLNLIVEDPFFNRMTSITDVL